MGWRTPIVNEQPCKSIVAGVNGGTATEECLKKYQKTSTLMNVDYPDGSDGTISQPLYFCKWDSTDMECQQGDQCDDSWGPLDVGPLPGTPYYSAVPTPAPSAVPGR